MGTITGGVRENTREETVLQLGLDKWVQKKEEHNLSSAYNVSDTTKSWLSPSVVGSVWLKEKLLEVEDRKKEGVKMRRAL